MQSEKPKSLKSYSHIRAALYGQPVAISESGLDLVLGIVEARSEGIVPEETVKARAGDEQNEEDIPHLQMVGNVALISVLGPIFPRANLFTRISSMTSAKGIQGAIDAAKEQEPSAYCFLYDSPGGAVSLGFETAEAIWDLRNKSAVPVVSVVEGSACSLAYLWASQADKIYTGVDSVLGSISVVMRMMSDDRAQRNAGVDSFTIKSGSLKQMDDPKTLAFVNQYQSLINQCSTWHDMFVSAVQRGRKGIDAAAVATGEIWIGQKSVDAGLADEVATLAKVLKELQ